jgi:hypothetical protein
MLHRQPLTRGRGDLIASGPLGVKWCVSKLSLSPRWPGVDGLTMRDKRFCGPVRNFWGESMTRQPIRRNFLFCAFAAIPVTRAVGVSNAFRAPDLTTAHMADADPHAEMLIFFTRNGLLRDFRDA